MLENARLLMTCPFRTRGLTSFSFTGFSLRILNFCPRIITIDQTFICNWNFGHEVRICMKTILQFRSNRDTIFLLFISQKSGNKFSLIHLICKLSVKMLCTDLYAIWSSSVSSCIVILLFERTNFATFLHVFICFWSRKTLPRLQPTHFQF